MKLQIEAEALSIIHEHAIADFPNECCGFLFGQNSTERIITEAKPVQNSKSGDQRRRFEIAPLDYLAAENYALENELMLLGIYHSHPKHPAIPSEHDRIQAVTFFSYIITSVEENKIEDTTSWRLSDKKTFQTESIEVLHNINN